MSNLVFNVTKGRKLYHKGECFLPLKSREDIHTLFDKQAVEPEEMTSILYKPEFLGFSRAAKNTVIRYYNELIDHDSIKDFIIKGTKGSQIYKNGVDLPLEISGSAIYIILSLFRYGAECPTMVMTAMDYMDLGMDFDTALYLAHYTYYREDDYFKQLPSTIEVFPQRPVNHSIVDPVRVYKGGDRFLTDTLPVLAGISQYKDTFGYGNIQGIMKVNNGPLLKDFPSEVSSADMAIRLAAEITG